MGLGDVLGAVFPVPAIGTAIGGLLGGAGQYFAGREANEANLEAARMNAEMQREFAQMGIQWRVEDAQKAGIHPLAALGAQGASFSPSAVGDMGDSLKWEALSNMGQNISRAALSAATEDERVLNKLRIAREMAEIDLIKAQTSHIGAPSGPAMPRAAGGDPYLMGQGDVPKALAVDTGRVRDVPMTRIIRDSKAPHKEAGAIPDTQIVRTKDGYAVVPGDDVKNRIEDSPMEYQWLIRNMFRVYNNPESGRPALMNPFTGELFHVPFTKGKKKFKSAW